MSDKNIAEEELERLKKERHQGKDVKWDKWDTRRKPILAYKHKSEEALDAGYKAYPGKKPYVWQVSQHSAWWDRGWQKAEEHENER